MFNNMSNNISKLSYYRLDCVLKLLFYPISEAINLYVNELLIKN